MIPNDVNMSPELNKNIQRYGVKINNQESKIPPNEDVYFNDVFKPQNKHKQLEKFDNNVEFSSPYTLSPVKTNIAQYVPSNIDKLLENGIKSFKRPDNIDYKIRRPIQKIKLIENMETERRRVNNNNPIDEMMEIITFLGTGVFIILVLDIISRK